MFHIHSHKFQENQDLVAFNPFYRSKYLFMWAIRQVSSYKTVYFNILGNRGNSEHELVENKIVYILLSPYVQLMFNF